MEEGEMMRGGDDEREMMRDWEGGKRREGMGEEEMMRDREGEDEEVGEMMRGDEYEILLVHHTYHTPLSVGTASVISSLCFVVSGVRNAKRRLLMSCRKRFVPLVS